MMKQTARIAHALYFGIGILAIGILGACVIFAVVARYCFSLSWKQLEEFMTTLFAFSTFWGMGICVLRNEHVIIDVLYDRIPPVIKRWVTFINDLIMLTVTGVVGIYSINYVEKAGNQLSMGMEIPMMYMYGIMPVCLALSSFCIVLRAVRTLRAPIEEFAPKNKVLT